MSLNDLPTPASMAGRWDLSKGKSRLQVKAEARPLTKVDDKAFKKEVWTRDQHRCRCCGRKVRTTIDRVPERGEVHHCHGRRGDLRFEARSALLLCLTCHEKVTGKVNEKWIIVPTVAVWWWLTKSDGTRYMDARKSLKFERAA